MPRPVITLTTDFGTQDHFVGVMKGVMLGICPQAIFVDITHEIPPFEIGDGSFTVAELCPYFPRRTVHLVVVDPGVGTSRRAILVEAAGQYFVGPDNGVFSMLLQQQKHKVRALTVARYFRPVVSQTFQGRDVFAPVAAHLAAGVAPAKLGKLVKDAMCSTQLSPQQTARRQWVGTVVKADRFGNLITNFHEREFSALLAKGFHLTIGFETFDELAGSYAAAPVGQPLLIVGSSGYLEVCANQASAAKVLGCGAGAPVELTIAKG